MINNSIRLMTLLAAIWFYSATANAQTILFSTTLNGAVTNSTQTVVVGSATVSTSATTSTITPAVGMMLYVDHEAMTITAINGTRLTVTRGVMNAAQAHATSAVVYIGNATNFRVADPERTAGLSAVPCVSTAVGVRPFINTTNGNIWYCNSSLWQGGNVLKLTYGTTGSPY